MSGPFLTLAHRSDPVTSPRSRSKTRPPDPSSPQAIHTLTVLFFFFFFSRIARRSGNAVLSSGGVVRGITNWGTCLLPKAQKRKDQGTFHHAHYFIMRFDSSPKAQHSMRHSLTSDPRLLSYHVLSLGGSLAETVNTPARLGWGTTLSQEKVDTIVQADKSTWSNSRLFSSTVQAEASKGQFGQPRAWSDSVATPAPTGSTVFEQSSPTEGNETGLDSTADGTTTTTAETTTESKPDSPPS